jgi:hypothetical protein
MTFVHQHHEIVQARQIIEIAQADVLAQPLDAGGTAPANLAVDLRDIEDVDVAVVGIVIELAIGRFGCVMVDEATYNGSRFSAVHFIEQSPIAKAAAKSLWASDQDGDIEWD